MAHRHLRSHSLRTGYSEFSFRERPAKFRPFQIIDNERDDDNGDDGDDDPRPYKRRSRSPDTFHHGEFGAVRRTKQKRKSLKDRSPIRPCPSGNDDGEHQEDISPSNSVEDSEERSETQTQKPSTFDWSDILGYTPRGLQENSRRSDAGGDTAEVRSSSMLLDSLIDITSLLTEKRPSNHQSEYTLPTSNTRFLPSKPKNVGQSEFSRAELNQSDSGILTDSVNSLDSSNESLYLGNQSSFSSLLNSNDCGVPPGNNKLQPFSTSTPTKSVKVSEDAFFSNNKRHSEEESLIARTCDISSIQPTDEDPQVYPAGSIVWGKFWKMRWFPAIVIDGRLAGKKPARSGFVWVMWFGDYKITELRLMSVEPFYRQFETRCGHKLKPLAEKAVVGALQACADRLKIEFPTYNSILKWRFSDTFQNYVQQGLTEGRDPFAMPKGASLPRLILKNLRKISSQKVSSNASDMADDADDDDDDGDAVSLDQHMPRSGEGDTKTEERQVLKAGDRNTTDFCLSCGKHGLTIVGPHPLFEGYICGKCQDSLRESLYALDDDGCCLFCNICGEGGQLLVCDSLDCGRSFCMGCVKKYISHDDIRQLKARNPWLCFLCTPHSLPTHGYILPRAQWRLDLLAFFNPVQGHMEDVLTSYRPGEKRRLRVLSLFDGIGTVKLALDQLGVDIDVYYACETSADAQIVTTFNHGFAITQLGDAYKLDRQTLQDICPIDLVVGNPPTHDLDITNRDFEGFNETGMLSVKFLMILREVELLSGADNHRLFWLLENTACMKSEFYKMLTLLLEGEPCMWDGQYFAEHIHPCYYWGNLPGLYSAVEYCTRHDGTEFTLNSAVGRSLSRKAMVSKLRAPSINFKPNQLPKGGDSDTNGCASHRLPILMDGKPAGVWINEVERVFGFPEHYTDASLLTIGQRQKLMTQASSVAVLKHLFSPLTKLFAMKQ